MHGQLGWGANTAKIYCKAICQAICYMPDMPAKCNGKLLRCNTCPMMACVPHPNVHNCHHGKGGLEEGSKKGKSTAILQPVKVTKCNILQNVLHCTKHNAHVIIPITRTYWQLYICCCESGHFCQLNCVAVGDGADYGSCWVWREAKRGVEG